MAAFVKYQVGKGVVEPEGLSRLMDFFESVAKSCGDVCTGAEFLPGNDLDVRLVNDNGLRTLAVSPKFKSAADAAFFIETVEAVIQNPTLVQNRQDPRNATINVHMNEISLYPEGSDEGKPGAFKDCQGPGALQKTLPKVEAYLFPI